MEGQAMGSVLSLGILVVMIVIFYFFLIRPQKKREKESAKMRNGVDIGDDITTIGGISGRVVQLKDEDYLVIETGTNGTKLKVARWAIQSVDTLKDA